MHHACKHHACLHLFLPQEGVRVKSRPDAFVRTSLSSVCSELADVLVFFLQKQSQLDASGKVSQHAGRDLLLDRGMSGSSGTNSGIPADYGAATGSADPSSNPPSCSGPATAPSGSTGVAFMETKPPLYTVDDAAPAIRTSGDHIGMVGEALTPTTQTLGQVLDEYAFIHVHEEGRIPMTQIPGHPPAHTFNTQTPQDAPEAEETPACTEHGSESDLTVIIQQLLKTVEAAAKPAQSSTPHLRSGGVTINCMLPSDNRAQLAVLITDAFLVSVDVFQQEGKFPAAMTLVAKVGYVFVGSQSALT